MPCQAGSSTNAGRSWIWIRSFSCLFLLPSPVIVTVSSHPPHGEMGPQRALGWALQSQSCVLYLLLSAPLPSSD